MQDRTQHLRTPAVAPGEKVEPDGEHAENEAVNRASERNEETPAVRSFDGDRTELSRNGRSGRGGHNEPVGDACYDTGNATTSGVVDIDISSRSNSGDGKRYQGWIGGNRRDGT
jgi:hypothetical protein